MVAAGHDEMIPLQSQQVKSNVVRKQTSLQTPGLMALNFCSAVGIVVVNKALFRRSEGLGFATSLTALHFAFTALGVRVCHLLGMYKTKPLKQRQVRLIYCRHGAKFVMAGAKRCTRGCWITPPTTCSVEGPPNVVCRFFLPNVRLCDAAQTFPTRTAVR